jgi:hypothetical protein
MPVRCEVLWRRRLACGFVLRIETKSAGETPAPQTASYKYLCRNLLRKILLRRDIQIAGGLAKHKFAGVNFGWR